MKKIIAISAIILVTTIAGFVVLKMISQYAISTVNTPPSTVQALPTYTVNEVNVICEIFNFNSNDEFCSHAAIQNADTLEASLNTHYPSGLTNYDDLIPRLSEIPSIPSHFCERKLAAETSGYTANNCPLPTQCTEDYQCNFSFSMAYNIDINLRIGIDVETGQIGSYGVSRPSDSP